MGLEKTPWLILGTPFRCTGVPPEINKDVEALLAGFPRAGEVQEAETVEVRCDSVAPVSSHVEYRLIDEAIRRARGRWILHAGAVAGPGGTCLLIGESGAGKTSLTLWLWAAGLRLGTDDLCPIAHESLAPEVFPRALHMDAEYSPRLMANIPPRPAGYPADYYPFPGETEAPLPPVRDLLVLERGPNPEGEAEPLSQAEAAHHLLKAVIKTPGFDFGGALSGMVRLASQCRAHRLRSATPEGAGERALALLARS